MPLPNRVTPAGALIAVAARGTLLGNRGVLHDPQGRLTGRRWTTQAWVTCLLEFRGRRRPPMPPGRWTALFFLDEATALAAGHRPCGECRHADYRRFKALWAPAAGLTVDVPIATLERGLHAERTHRGPHGETHAAPLADLPDGVLVLDGAAEPWLVWGAALWRWSPAGYAERRPRPREGRVAVLTPPTTVRVLAAGYVPTVHPSAGGKPHPL
jgi:hypothetical protein